MRQNGGISPVCPCRWFTIITMAAYPSSVAVALLRLVAITVFIAARVVTASPAQTISEDADREHQLAEIDRIKQRTCVFVFVRHASPRGFADVRAPRGLAMQSSTATTSWRSLGGATTKLTPCCSR